MDLTIPMYIDSHCHIHLSEFDLDREAVFERAHAVGVHYFMVVGNDHQSNQQGFDLLQSRSDCYFALGIHPHHINEWTAEVKQWIDDKMTHPKVKAVGEAGLDYFKNPYSKEQQETVLRDQIDLALKYNKPIVLHIRDAFDDAYHILKDYPRLRFVMHCFTGSQKDIEWIVQMGGYISLSGIVTFANAKTLKDVVPSIPRDKLLWETDAPFLAPGKHRGKRCEPSFIIETAQTVADLYQTALPQLADQVLINTKTIFDFEDISTPSTK